MKPRIKKVDVSPYALPAVEEVPGVTVGRNQRRMGSVKYYKTHVSQKEKANEDESASNQVRRV